MALRVGYYEADLGLSCPPEGFLVPFFWCSKDLGVYPMEIATGGHIGPSIIERQRFFSVIFEKKSVGTPKLGGILRGAPPHFRKSEATVIDNTPHIS